MNLKQLEYVIAIAEEHSISGAARRLFLSPSALSQYLSRLESEEQLPPLFRREKGGYYLTDAGRIYVNGARRILDLSSKMEHNLKNRSTAVRLMLAPVFEHPFLTQVLPRFKNIFPHAVLTVRYGSSSEAKRRIEEGGEDAAVIFDQQKTYSSFRYAPVYEDRVVWVMCSDDSGLSLKSLPVIVPPSGTFWRGTCDDILSQERFLGEIYCETTDINSIVHLMNHQSVTALMLESVFRQITAEGKPEAGRLRALPLSRSYPYYISVLTPLNFGYTSPLSNLVDLLTEYLNPYLHPADIEFPSYRRL